MSSNNLKKLFFLPQYIFLLITLSYQFSFAEPVYIRDFEAFPSYPYNTEECARNGELVGCVSTASAMVLAYYEHVFLPDYWDILTLPQQGVNEGLETAWRIHNQYLEVQENGFCDQTLIKAGIENYASDRDYNFNVKIHVPSDYGPNSTQFTDYGNYGDAWMNDGYFWDIFQNRGKTYWKINPDDFISFVDAMLDEGVAMWLTIDTDADHEGDRLVPLVGYDSTTQQYAFHDTCSADIQWADIHAAEDTGDALPNAIDTVWTVRFLGPSDVYDHGESGTGDLICPSGFHSILTDLDADGNYDTQVVYTTLSGMGRIEDNPDGSPGYRHSCTYQHATPPPLPCAGEFQEGSGQFLIHFVDMLAEGWEYNNSTTWQYKRVASVSIDSDYAPPVRPGITEGEADQSVHAYSDLNQSNEIEGNHDLLLIENEELVRHVFSHDLGIKELYITTDYETNSLDRLLVAGEDSSQSRISLSPDAYHCGCVPAGETSEPLVVTIANTGTENLTITNMSLDDEAHFTLDVASCVSTSPTITPGENCGVNIIYHPTGPPEPLAYHQAVLSIESNDHTTPAIHVPLYGTTAPVIPPGYVIMEHVADTIDSPQRKDYTVEVSKGSQIYVGSEGSLLRLSAYAPSGQLYDEAESASPIIVDVVASKPGLWQLNVTAVNTPSSDYPFELRIHSPEDIDADGVHIYVDNCNETPNGLSLGTCVKIIDGAMLYTSHTCASYADCGVDEVCEKYQWDFQENGVGDACKCESDFDCTGAVDGGDVATLLHNFGRSQYVRPCTNGDQCKGDIYCDGDVDGADIIKFLEDFGRSEFYNPCPPCVVGAWCTYPPIIVDIDVENDRFDADNNNSTQIDTVTIGVGDTVRWTWREGTHTITNGLSSDPLDNPGTLFDEPSDSFNQSFSFAFTEAGTFPYFCRDQESLEMKGIIEVQ